MNIKTQHRIMEIANWVARNIPGAKSLMKPFYYKIKKGWKTDRNTVFRSQALEVLNDFHNCMERNGYEYTLAFGSMLGAVREKGFIKHDIDIDTTMWIDEWNENLEKCLNNAGFVLDHKFLIDDGTLGREETYKKNGVSIDIFYIYPPYDKLPYCCDFMGYDDAPTYKSCNKKYGGAQPRRIELPFERDRKLVDFEAIKLYIPTNANTLLEFRYGASYMTPNPNWTVGSYDNHIIRWKEKRGVYEGD